MTRKISVLFVLTIFVLSLGVSAFAAKAVSGRTGVDPRDIVPLSSLSPASVHSGVDDVAGDGQPIITPGGFASFIDLGYTMATSRNIGSTYQDYQKNGSMGRQIVYGGGDGGLGSGTDSTWVHNVFMVLPGASTASRAVSYYAWRQTVGTIASDGSVDPNTGAGYITVDFDYDGAGSAVIAYHRVADGGTKAAKDFGLATASFSPFLFTDNNCEGISTGQSVEATGNYIWPVVAADINATGDPICYTISSESPAPPTAAGDIQSIVFFKSDAGITGPSATCGNFIDSVYDIAPVVVQDPASNKVAVVYSKPRAYMANGGQRNNDIVYWESNNLGTRSWTFQNVSNYATGEVSRAYTEVSAVYSGGCLHIVWPDNELDSVAGTVSTRANKLWHWDDCGDCRSLVTAEDAFAATCGTGVWNHNIAKVTVSECKTGADTRLYVTYTRFTADDDIPASDDCSAAGFANGEIYIQASATSGVTWGPPTNITNTISNNCALGGCNSEHWSSAAPYSNDSLYIQYILDKDAGGIVQTEGGWTNNPVMSVTYPCITMATFSDLAPSPASFLYPLHTVPTQTHDENLTVTNSGNASTTYNYTVTYINGAGWISFPNGSSSTCLAGCTNSDTKLVRFTGPASEGLYKATINLNFPNGEKATVPIAVELYNFTNFFLPQSAQLRTSCSRMGAAQTARAANGAGGTGTSNLTYFSDQLDYVFDGTLLTARTATGLSSLMHEGGGGTATPDPNVGKLWANSNTVYDSTSSSSWRKASGKGVNRDSVVGFDVAWFAPKHPDSCNFYIICICLYAGPKYTGGSSTNWTFAYGLDFDVPSDSNADNAAGFDEDMQMVHQQGGWNAPFTSRWAGMAGYNGDATPIEGGMVLDNPHWLYPWAGYKSDTLWNKMQALVGYEAFAGPPAYEDLNSVLVFKRGKTVLTTDSTWIYIIIATKEAGSTLTQLKAEITKGKKFLCDHVAPNQPVCDTGCTACGDADSSGGIDISDAVFLIQFIFQGGPAPADCNYTFGMGDADGSGGVDISDAVYLIQYIFQGGPAPHCQGQ
jgi:hypothetical protein